MLFHFCFRLQRLAQLLFALLFGLRELLQVSEHVLVISAQFHTRLLFLLEQKLELPQLFLGLEKGAVHVNSSVFKFLLLLLHFVVKFFRLLFDL